LPSLTAARRRGPASTHSPPGRHLPAAPLPVRCRAGLPLLAALGAGGRRPSLHGRDLTAPGARARAAVEGVKAPAKTCDIRHHPHLPPSCRPAVPSARASQTVALHRHRAGTSRPDTIGDHEALSVIDTRVVGDAGCLHRPQAALKDGYLVVPATGWLAPCLRRHNGEPGPLS